jgi:transcriptional regulator with PAS, ATPase and Fis domain
MDAASLLELSEVRPLVAHLHRRWNVAVSFVAADDQPALQAAHAGLESVTIPVIARGGPAGALVVSGVLRLGAHDLAHVKDLIQLCADELGGYLGSTGAQVAAHGAPARPLDEDLPRTRYDYEAIIGKSRAMTDLYRVLDRVIDSDTTVLVQGENGTGKELIAKAIHFNSARATRRFVVQNCSAFNDNLLDSELFGHRKGAFTGAVVDKQGLFEVADGGTFFLDEIGDMSATLQVKLLRVLQEGTFIPVGDTQSRHVDVRIIAATNRDLATMVARGEFREDLYYRVNVINLTVPPLRERKDDLPVLVEHFLRKHGKNRGKLKKLTRGCLERLVEYPWPGNVRELENEMERLVVLAGDERLVGEELLSPRIRTRGTAAAGATNGAAEVAAAGEAGGLPDAIAALERHMIGEVLKRHAGNKTRAASELRISRRNLIRLVQKYRIESKRR